MVLLTMTAPLVEALEKLESQSTTAESTKDRVKLGAQDTTAEPSLSEPSIGKPISHGQVIDIYKELKNKGDSSYHLDTLLRGSRVYISPAPPKPEPVGLPPPTKLGLHRTCYLTDHPQTPEYKALMSRLRREEEARAYERMINPYPPLETFSQRFPTASAAYAFSSTAAYESFNKSTAVDDITYTDVNRQITLIFNVLISIAACAAAIWMAAKWWDTPAKLALSMSGSLLVGIAEVVVYTGYIRRLGEAKGKEGAVKEVKEIVKTWVVGGEEDGIEKENTEPHVLIDKEDISTVRERKRRKEPS
jgi:hypothetical protein